MQPNENSNKSILARACDPAMAQHAAVAISALVGDPEYIAATNDEDFIEKLNDRSWSVVFFAPGACRFSAARMPIPGGNDTTRGWSLEQYRNLVRETQGDGVKIVETQDEAESVPLLREALATAREALAE